MKDSWKPFAEAIVMMVVVSLVAIGWNAVSSSGIPLSGGPGRASDDDLGPGGGGGEVTGVLHEIDLARFREMLAEGGRLVLDARSTDEFLQGHIPGAKNLPYDEYIYFYDHVLRDVPKDREIVTYCISEECDLSHDLADQLRLEGFTSVSVYVGGFEEWLANDLPYEEGEGGSS